MKGEFDKGQYRSFTHDVAASLAQLAALVRMDGTEEEYLACVDFGAGAMAALNVVREALESGSVPGGTSMLLQFASVFDGSQANKDMLRKVYRAKGGKGKDKED